MHAMSQPQPAQTVEAASHRFANSSRFKKSCHVVYGTAGGSGHTNPAAAIIFEGTIIAPPYL